MMTRRLTMAIRAFAGGLALALAVATLDGAMPTASAGAAVAHEDRLQIAQRQRNDPSRIVPSRPAETVQEVDQPLAEEETEEDQAAEDAAAQVTEDATNPDAEVAPAQASPAEPPAEPQQEQPANPPVSPTPAPAEAPLPQPRPGTENEFGAGSDSSEAGPARSDETPAQPAERGDDVLDDPSFSGPDRDGPGARQDPEFIPEAEEAIRQELEMGPDPSFRLTATARLTEDGPAVPDGLVWRVFRAQPQPSGSFELVDESREAQPSFLLPADDYILHVAYGLANSASRVSLQGGHVEEQVVLEAGGLRITPVNAQEQAIGGRRLSLSIYSSEEDEYGQRRLILQDADPRAIIRLNPGTYHVVSRFGRANAEVRADVQVNPGELTEARIQHRSAAVTLKLVNEAGGEALADTSWTIMTPDGETVKESFGAFPSHILIEGDYTAVARHNGRVYNRDFDVEPGVDREIELLAR